MCPKKLIGVDKDKKATEIIIQFIDLQDDLYRMGNTKVYEQTIYLYFAKQTCSNIKCHMLLLISFQKLLINTIRQTIFTTTFQSKQYFFPN